jgi:hypothetical protein
MPLLTRETNLDEGVYQLVKHSKLHKVVMLPTILPYEESISWVFSRSNVDNMLIKDTHGKSIMSFQNIVLHIYYKIPVVEIDLTKERMLQISLDCRKVMNILWVLKKISRERRTTNYLEIMLRNSYNISISLPSRLYGEEDAINFK